LAGIFPQKLLDPRHVLRRGAGDDRTVPDPHPRKQLGDHVLLLHVPEHAGAGQRPPILDEVDPGRRDHLAAPRARNGADLPDLIEDGALLLLDRADLRRGRSRTPAAISPLRAREMAQICRIWLKMACAPGPRALFCGSSIVPPIERALLLSPTTIRSTLSSLCTRQSESKGTT